MNDAHSSAAPISVFTHLLSRAKMPGVRLVPGAKPLDFEKILRLGPDGGHAKGVIPMFIEDSYP